MEEHSERPGLSLKGYWLRIRDHRWWLLGLAFAGWVIATTVSGLLPPKYRSETVILVEQQKIPEHYVEPNVASDLQHRLQSMSEQILSRTRLLAIIDKFHMYAGDRTGINADGLVDRMRQNINIELVRTAGRDELSAFKISYSDSNPSTAQQITGELTSLFINENLRNRAQLSEDTTAFLENQLKDARRSLDEQEQRLREFRSSNVGQLPDQLQSNVQILAGLQNQLQGETDSLNRSEQQRTFLQYQYRALGGTAGAGEVSGVSAAEAELNRKLDVMKEKLDDLTNKYTPQHPDVVAVRSEIAAIEAQRARDIERAKDPKSKDAPPLAGLGLDRRSSSPLTVLEGHLEANTLEIANQKEKIKRIEREIDGYRARLNRAPIREQQLAAVTRDYEQSRTYYESLLAKKLQSEMATNLEKRQQGEQFRMIDPPNLPEKPYWPKRWNFSLAGLAIGTFLALGIIVLRETSHPRIYEDRELREMEGLKVLISIPKLSTEREKRRAWRRHILESAVFSLVSGIMAAGTLMVYFKG